MKIYLSLRREIPKDFADYDGVGLLKSEYSTMKAHISDREELSHLKHYLLSICAIFKPKPVWYRLNDASTAFINTLHGNSHHYTEKNAHFGLRGVRRALVQKATALEELAMVNDVRAIFPNLNILLPFINDAKQYRQYQAMAKQAGYDGRIGIMAELPSAVLTLDDFIDAGCDYVVFGMNDLSDCIEGISRKNTETEHLIHRDKKKMAVKKLLSLVKKRDGVEYVLSGDLQPEIVNVLKDFQWDAFALPYYQIGKEFSRLYLAKLRGKNAQNI